MANQRRAKRSTVGRAPRTPPRVGARGGKPHRIAAASAMQPYHATGMARGWREAWPPQRGTWQRGWPGHLGPADTARDRTAWRAAPAGRPARAATPKCRGRADAAISGRLDPPGRDHGLSLSPRPLAPHKDSSALVLKYGAPTPEARPLEEVLATSSRRHVGGHGSAEASRSSSRLGPTSSSSPASLTRADLLPIRTSSRSHACKTTSPRPVRRRRGDGAGRARVRLSKAFLEFDTTPLAPRRLPGSPRRPPRGRVVAVKGTSRLRFRRRRLEVLGRRGSAGGYSNGSALRLPAPRGEFRKSLRVSSTTGRSREPRGPGPHLARFPRLFVPQPRRLHDLARAHVAASRARDHPAARSCCSSSERRTCRVSSRPTCTRCSPTFSIRSHPGNLLVTATAASR